MSLLVASFYVFAQPNIAEVPFKLDDATTVYIKSESDVDFPLAIYYESNGKSHKVESYETDGDEPTYPWVAMLVVLRLDMVMI